MLDVNYIARSTEGNYQIWFGPNSIAGTASTASYYTFVKPRGCTMLNFFVVGAGGGAGWGFASATTTARGGGGGGGSGGITNLAISTILLPDLLYIVPGAGGRGATAAATASTAGGQSFVSLLSPTATSDYFLVSAPGGGAGGNGTAAAAGSFGTGPVASTGDKWGTLGNYSAITAQAGASGGGISSGLGPSVSWGGTGRCLVGGGAGGGGGSNFAGGDMTGVGIVPTVSGGTGSGVSGKPGSFFRQPFVSWGGSGGGSGLTTAVGSPGGDGGVGSGGGGGGAGGVAGGGAGGCGGPGMIMVSWW